MTYDELNQKYLTLLKENELYKKKYGPINLHDDQIKTEVKTENIIGVNNNSSPKEKIDLFRSLFVGRNDVYAHRWSNKAGKSGYSPVCLNEWKENICNKPKVKCANCDNRKFKCITDTVIKEHLLGNEVIGIYPMIEDETCRFLAIDFDKDEWEKDVDVLRQVCNEKDIPIAIERSRSGNGAHAWFFFDTNINAIKARKFGTSLLTYSMNTRHEISFTSYDRLFPNQDNMPKGGFGNLIALPLQKAAREKGNSIFIDEYFVPHVDQWDFLSKIKYIKKSQLNSLIDDLSDGHELGELENYNEKGKPWQKPEKVIISKKDFPKKLTIVKANMLYIPKSGVSSKVLNKMKRLATFNNPDFYKTQAMRLPVYDKPRLISLANENDDYVFIPRGCEEKLLSFLSAIGVKPTILNEQNQGVSIDVEFNGELREQQSEALEALLKYDNGILQAATAFGKTVVGAKLISDIKHNTLILVHTKQLLFQWKERLSQFLIINEPLPQQEINKRKRKDLSIIGQIGGGKNTAHNIIDIALVQSLISKGKVKEIVKNYGLVIVDECHHAASYTHEQILKEVCARNVYGLTATPIRRDGQQPIAFMCCGDIRYKVDARSQINSRLFDHYIVPRFTKCKMLRTVQEKMDIPIHDVFAHIVNSQVRNNLIVQDIIENYKKGRNLIVLTERTEHITLLYDMVKTKIKNVFVLSGQVKKKKVVEIMDTLNNLPHEENVLIIATGKYIGEGFDYPRLDTLLLTFPVSWRGRLQQYAGRLHREYASKNDVMILDYVDIHIRVLEKMYQKRLKGYASIGYKIKSDYNSTDSSGIIFDEVSFLDVFSKDISVATQKILISTPYISKRKTMQMVKLLQKSILNDVEVIIATKPIDEYKENDKLRIQSLHDTIISSNIFLVIKPNIYQKYAIIDNSIVWFGSINLLSYGSSHESIIRLFDREIGNELLNNS